ncbi:ABC transporter permease [Deltaproteobacteria bacterium OttesenSCG-928-K17]|nr:ABC transporter permease [Deltaproteobacteria bacterium OttesenSCG-928-K17]
MATESRTPSGGRAFFRPAAAFETFVGWLGRLLMWGAGYRVVDQAGFAGRILILTLQGFSERQGLLFRLTLTEIYKLVRGVMPLLLLVGFMLGFLWSLLWYGTLSNIGGLENISMFLVSIHTIQITPIMTTVIVILRYGAPTCWELAVMKSSRQFETMTLMGIPPEHFLAAPRIAGAVLAMPALLVIFSLASFAGAYYLAWRYNSQTVLDFVFALSNQTSGFHFATMAFKSVVISLSVSFFCIYNGFSMPVDGLNRGAIIMRRAMGEAFFYSVLFSVLVSVFYV